MPTELVDPFVWFRHIPGWSVDHPTLKTDWLQFFLDSITSLAVAVDDQRLVGVDQDGLPDMDAGVLGWVEVELDGTGEAESWSSSLVYLG